MFKFTSASRLCLKFLAQLIQQLRQAGRARSGDQPAVSVVHGDLSTPKGDRGEVKARCTPREDDVRDTFCDAGARQGSQSWVGRRAQCWAAPATAIETPEKRLDQGPRREVEDNCGGDGLTRWDNGQRGEEKEAGLSLGGVNGAANGATGAGSDAIGEKRRIKTGAGSGLSGPSRAPEEIGW